MNATEDEGKQECPQRDTVHVYNMSVCTTVSVLDTMQEADAAGSVY